MRIGKQDHPLTAIATSDATSITVRGHDLCEDLIGKINFTEYLWFLVVGEKPTKEQAAMTDACLVAIAITEATSLVFDILKCDKTKGRSVDLTTGETRERLE